MAEIGVKVEGLDKLQRAYRNNPGIRKAISDGIYRVVLDLEGASKKQSPVRTGALRSQIYSRFFPSAVQGFIATGPNTPYAIFVHEGTRFMRANPFMERAVELNKSSIQGQLTKLAKDIAQELKF